jgi:excisionase family DNA binding protein
VSSSPKPLEPLLSPKQVSEYTGVPVTTLAIWRCTGRVHIPYLKVGRAVRYRREDIEAYLASGGGTSQPKQVRHQAAEMTVQMFALGPCEGCDLMFPSFALAGHSGSRRLCPTCHRQAHQVKAHQVKRPTSLPLRTPKIADRPCASEEPPQRRKPRRAP